MSYFLRHPVILIIGGLALLGFAYRLLTNPVSLFIYLVVAALIAAGLYFLFTRVLLKRMGGPKVDKNYRKALKQSKARKKQAEQASKANISKRRQPNLTVIQGKKKNK